MTRGVLYITWGNAGELLRRSRSSLGQWHPELDQHVIDLPSDSTILAKSKMFDLSPFDETLFLDVDTVVMGKLDYGFEKAANHGIACCICECPWARRYSYFIGDAIEFNTGVLFWTRKANPVFDAWAKLAPKLDSSLTYIGPNGPETMSCNDQASFAAAIDQTGFNPWILPLNWNFRHRWQKTVFGPVKIWHDYDPVPASLAEWNESQAGTVISCGRI